MTTRLLTPLFRMRTVATLSILIILPLLVIGYSLQSDVQKQAEAHTHEQQTARTLHPDNEIVSVPRSFATDVFAEPVVSIVFDGGWESVYTHAFPILELYGIDSTQFIITGTLENQHYMSAEQITHMHDYGHEIASHTVTHRDLTTLDRGELSNELYNSRITIEALTQEPSEDLALPRGAYSEGTVAAARIWYRSLRTTEAGVNTYENFDAYQLLSPTIVSSNTIADLEEYLEQARNTNGWLILAYQQIGDATDDYTISPEMFEAQLKTIVASGIDIQPYGDVLDMIKEKY